MEQRRLFLNTLFAVLSKNAINILGFFTGIALIRLLSTEDYGVYAYVSSLVGIFGVVINFGLNSYFLREMAKEPETAKGSLATFFGIQTALAVLVTAVVIGVALFQHDADTRYGIVLFGAGIFVASLFSPFMCMLAAHQRNDLVYVHMFVQALVQLALTLLGFFKHLPLLYYMAIPFITATARLAHNIYDNRRLGWAAWPSFVIKKWQPIFKASLPFGVLTGLSIVYMKIDVIFFANFQNTYWTAVYSVSSRLAYVLILLPHSVVENLYPYFSRQKDEEKHSYRVLLEKFTYFNWLICLPLVVGGIMVAKELIVMLFGERYLAAYEPFCLYLCYPLLVGLYIGFHHYLMAHGKIWYLVKVGVVCLTLNVIGNYTVLHLWEGKRAMIGAACVTLLTEALDVVLSMRAVHRQAPFKPPILRLLRVVGPLFLMAACLYAAHPLPVLLRIALGACVYLASAWWMGVLEPEDRERLRALWRQVRSTSR